MNIIDIYLNYKDNNLLKFTKILVSESSNFHMSEFSNEVVEKIIIKYLNIINQIDDDEVKLLDYELFLDDMKIKNKNTRKLGLLLLKEIKDFDTFYQNDKEVKYFKVLLDSILIAIELNKRTCSIVDSSISFKKSMKEIINEYSHIINLDVIRVLENDNPKLKDMYDESLKIKRKLIKHYADDNLELKLTKIKNNISKEKYYFANIKYNIKSLEMISNTKINEVIEENMVKEDIVYIILDKLSWLVLNSIINKEYIPNYIINIPNGMFKTKKNVKQIIKNFKNDLFKKHIVLKVDYKDVKKYNNNILTLIDKDISLAIDKIPKDYDFDYLKSASYIVLDKEDSDILNLIKESKIIPLLPNKGNRSDNFTIGLELNANK